MGPEVVMASGGFALIPTAEFTEKLLKARWEPDPEVAAALQYLVTLFSTPESDGMSKLERVYRTCAFEEMRNREIETAAIAFLQKRFKREYAVFTVDCAPDARVRLKLRIGASHRDLEKCIPATGEVWLNLLTPREDWIGGPRLVPSPPPIKAPSNPRAEKPGSKTLRNATLNRKG